MEYIKNMFALLATVFLILTLVINITPRFPRLPWDVDLRRPMPIYLPVISAVILTVILSIAFNLFKK